MKNKHAYSIIIVFTALMLAGLAFVPKLPVQLNPSHFLPTLNISCYWQNTSPVIMEQEVTTKLEGALGLIKGLEKINSVTSKGKSAINIHLDKYADIDNVRFEVASVIRHIYPALPDGVSYPQISLNRPDDEEIQPLITYTLNGSVLPWVLQQYAEKQIKEKLSFIGGVDKTDVYGASPLEWQLRYKPELIMALGITPKDIAKALSNYFNRQALGFGYEQPVSTGENKLYFSIALVPDLKPPAQWGSIPIKKTGNRIVYLSDIAQINQREKEPTSYFRINGLNTINVVVYPMKGVNNIVLAAKVKERIETIRTALPAGYTLLTAYDSTEYISAELVKIGWRSLFTILILLLFVFLVSLSFRYLLVIILSLFANISICFALYYFFKIEIHLYSLAGITISLGLIIDNTIVMVDHIRHQANRRVFLAILASTLTTIAALTFVLFLPDNLKLNLWDFAVIIIVNLTVSLIISLFFIPAIMVYVKIRPRNKKALYKRRRLIVRLSGYYQMFILFLLRFRKLALIAIILTFGLPVFLLPNHVDSDEWYAGLYNTTLGNNWYIENARPIVNKVLGGSLRLFVYYVYESSYYTRPEQTALYVSASLPKGTSIGQMNDVYLHLEEYLSGFTEIDKYITKIYSAQNANMVIYFKKPFIATSFPYVLKSRLIARSLDLGGVSWNIYGLGKGFSTSTGVNDMVNYKVSMYGYNYDELYRQANILKDKLLKHPRIKEVNIAGWKYWWEREKDYEYFLELDRKQAVMRNLSPGAIANALQNINTSGGLPLTLNTGNELSEVRILPASGKAPDVWNTFNLPMDTNNLKLGSVAKISKQVASQNIYKENQNYLRIIDYNYLGSNKFGNKYLDEVLDEISQEMPLGYSVKKSNMGYWLNEETQKQYGLLLLVMAIIFIICAVLFESLKQPLSIILVIPFSFTGIFITFYWFGFNFDQGGYASFILLSGLVVNSAIYIINEFNNLRKKYRNANRSSLKCYIKAFNYKIIPIVLTILSTILGLLPFIIYGQNEVFWFALAVGSIGGLMFSLLIIIFYLPLFVLRKQRT